MKIAVVLDEGTNPIAISRRRGNVANWVAHYSISALERAGHQVYVLPIKHPLESWISDLRKTGARLVFNMVDNVNNDPRLSSAIPALLDTIGIPYTGASAKGFELAGDKAVSKLIVAGHGISTPSFVVISDERSLMKSRDLKYPIIVKPASSDGSVGLTLKSVVHGFAGLRREVTKTIRVCEQPAICEQYIAGSDISVGLVGNGLKLRSLRPAHWRYPAHMASQLLTEKLKWSKVARDRTGIAYGFARLEASQHQWLESASRRIFDLLSLRDYGAIDYRLSESGKLYFIEANANPALTPTSYRWRSLPFRTLVRCIVSSAVSRYRE